MYIFAYNINFMPQFSNDIKLKMNNRIKINMYINFFLHILLSYLNSFQNELNY